MLNPLQSHIIFLENTIQSLRNRLTRPGLSVEEVEDIQLQLSLSESAFEHYSQAYALELKLSGSEPPNPPAGTEASGAAQDGQPPGPLKDKDGLVALGVFVSKKACRTYPKAAISERLRLAVKHSSEYVRVHAPLT